MAPCGCDKGTLPQVSQLAGPPVDAEIAAVLRGLNDFSAKPLSQRLRELQAADGRLEIEQRGHNRGTFWRSATARCP